MVAMLGCVVGLSACANKGLRDLSSNSQGPDEFLIQPVKPLAEPESYAALPTPTPGGVNLVDPTPKGDAVAALGGRASSLDPTGGVPSSDGALVTASSRYGVPANIRQTLAETDAEFRKRQARSSQFKLFRVDRYNQAYRREALDPFAENQRFRRAGLATPGAPPERE